MSTPISYFLVLSSILFAIGTVGVLVRKNALVIFMSVELQLNAVNLTLVAFSRMHNSLDGQVIAFFSMVVAAAEVVVGLAIIVSVYRRIRSVNVDDCRGAARMSARGSLWLIPALPLLGAALNLFVGKRLGRSAGIVASVLVAASFAVSLAVVGSLLGLGAQERVQTQHLFEWIHVGSFSVGATLRLDPLSATMILVVTGIGTLIHIYAIGYMRDDPRYGRFFAYMNLFVFFMLMLVLGQNLLVLYLGWEGVGLCSYLLIGFWFEKTENANAAKKAFVTTRIGDTAMLIGLALIVGEVRDARLLGHLRDGGEHAHEEPRRPRSRCCCSPARSGSPRRSRCTSGSPTPWRARPRSPR